MSASSSLQHHHYYHIVIIIIITPVSLITIIIVIIIHFLNIRIERIKRSQMCNGCQGSNEVFHTILLDRSLDPIICNLFLLSNLVCLPLLSRSWWKVVCASLLDFTIKWWKMDKLDPHDRDTWRQSIATCRNRRTPE